MSRKADFHPVLTVLWFRLITLGIVGLVFAEALVLAQGKAQGWSFYLTVPEVVFEIAVRVIFTALTGVVLGTLCTAALAPFLWQFDSARERIAEWAMKVAVFLVVFLDSRLALVTMIKWSYQGHSHRGIIDTVLWVAFYLGFAMAVCLPRARREVVTSLDGFLTRKMTRRTAIAAVAGTAALVATELVLAKASPVIRAALAPQRPKSNILLITFDALSAEDMSLYGYKLPTTPNIGAFARKSTVFNSFYSASTFTTPCVATMLTGMYPRRVRSTNSKLICGQRTPVAACRSRCGMAAMLPARSSLTHTPTIWDNTLRTISISCPNRLSRMAVSSICGTQPRLHQNSGFGNRIDEYVDLIGLWNPLWRLPGNLHERFRAAASFQNAREMLAKLSDGFFLWIHVMTPHGPYLPDSEERGRFLLPANSKFLRGKANLTGSRIIQPTSRAR